MDEISTLVVMFSDKNGKYHYAYVNEKSYDAAYGFTPIRDLVDNTLTTNPQLVFNRVDSIKQLGDVNIAMTDYGFWDLELNQTDNITYSFRHTGKSYKACTWNGHLMTNTKIILPDNHQMMPGSKICEYDKQWTLDDSTNTHWVMDDSTKSQFVDVVRVDGEKHKFVGGLPGNFALYDVSESSPAQLLVDMDENEFKRAIFADSELAYRFTEWLYGQVVYPNKGQKYIDDIKTDAWWTGDFQTKAETKSISDVIYPLSSSSFLVGKFEDIRHMIGDEATSLQDYCKALADINATPPSSDLNWLVSDQSSLEEAIKTWFRDTDNENGFSQRHKDGFV